MAALSWQISNDGTLDLAPNKNCFEVFQINFLINWGWGGGSFYFRFWKGPLKLSSASALLGSHFLPSFPY